MISSDNDSAAAAVLMIRPSHFGFNPETAASNIFQKEDSRSKSFEFADTVRNKAMREFDHFVSQLELHDIETLVASDREDVMTPDSVFPNNWFSTHPDGTVILYPMLSPVRRKERRTDLFETLLPRHRYFIKQVIDLSPFEEQNKFIEGTGSLVFDPVSKSAYANISSRTNQALVEQVCGLLNYEPVIFTAASADGREIYHTNVLLTVTRHFAVICDESIPDLKEREHVIRELTSSSREIIRLSYRQMEQFAGNMLQVRNTKDELITLMSQSAYASLDPGQLRCIERHSRILSVPVPTIEAVGGGSVRCMMAELFLPRVSG